MAPDILQYKEELVERVKAGLKRQVGGYLCRVLSFGAADSVGLQDAPAVLTDVLHAVATWALCS